MNKNLKIATFNSYPYHAEVIGYILNYCKECGYDITIYNDLKVHGGYIDFYKEFFNYGKYIEFSEFEKDKDLYDKVVLITDDDLGYRRKFKNNEKLNQKTISIDHFFRVRNNYCKYRICCRPFNDDRDWALPVYEINIPKKPHEGINIFLMGHSNFYNTSVFNRLRSSKKITIHIFSRHVNEECVKNLDKNIQVILYKNLHINEIFKSLEVMDFGITDVYRDRDSPLHGMSGMVPLMISILIPLIITIETNKYYQFKSALEYSRDPNTIIDLDAYTPNNLEEDRKNIMEHNREVFKKYF